MAFYAGYSSLVLVLEVLVNASSLPARSRAGTVAGMGRTRVQRTIVTVAAGAALLLSSAGACGGGGDGDDGRPGISEQQDGDDGDDDD